MDVAVTERLESSTISTRLLHLMHKTVPTTITDKMQAVLSFFRVADSSSQGSMYAAQHPLYCTPGLPSMAQTSSPSADGSPISSNAANVLGALGTLIGYLGSEVATGVLFERLLWPQRFYNGISTSNAWKLALFMPMGGPMHKAALVGNSRPAATFS